MAVFSLLECRSKRSLKGVFTTFASLMLAGCVMSPVPSADTMNNDGKLTALVDAYFEDALRLNPVAATYIGDARYNDRLTIDISPAHRNESTRLIREYLRAAEVIEPATLSPAARMTHAIFLYECNDALAAAQFPSYLLPIDQLGGTPTTLAEFGGGEGAQPFQTIRDYENFLQRMGGFSAWVTQAIANMREGMKANVVQPQAVMLKVLPQLRSMIVADPTQSVFYKPVANFPEAIASADRARLERAYRRAITRQIVPDYKRLHDFVRDEYLPRTRTTVAWTALPGGADWYQYLVRHYTTTTLEAASIHRTGLAEVARIRSEMSRVQAQLQIPGDLKAFFMHLENDPQQYYATPDDLLNAHRALKTRIDALLPSLFADFPKADYEIRPVEAFRAQASAGAFYQSPSADGSRPGIFYVNTFNLKAQPRFGVTTLSLHEAAPGHHFQIAIQQEIDDMPRFRRFFVGYTAYTEGWALYTESLGNGMGLFADPHQYFGHLNDEMLRAMRLVVDTGLHTQNWTRDQAIAYMLDNSYMAATDAEAEVERYIANPGQALGYKIGQLRILQLRTQAETALGSAFDIKQFHSQLLRDGPLPMDVLATKIDGWIESELRRNRIR
jgi:uncharacterized protein (DUF885 family)